MVWIYEHDEHMVRLVSSELGPIGGGGDHQTQPDMAGQKPGSKGPCDVQCHRGRSRMGQLRVRCFARSRNGMSNPKGCIQSCWPTLGLTGLLWRILSSLSISQSYEKAFCGMSSHSVRPPPGRVLNHRRLLCRCFYQAVERLTNGWTSYNLSANFGLQ